MLSTLSVGNCPVRSQRLKRVITVLLSLSLSLISRDGMKKKNGNRRLTRASRTPRAPSRLSLLTRPSAALPTSNKKMLLVISLCSINARDGRRGHHTLMSGPTSCPTFFIFFTSVTRSRFFLARRRISIHVYFRLVFFGIRVLVLTPPRPLFISPFAETFLDSKVSVPGNVTRRAKARLVRFQPHGITRENARNLSLNIIYIQKNTGSNKCVRYQISDLSEVVCVRVRASNSQPRNQ